MTEQSNLGDQTSRTGWIKVGYDRTIWIPCPPGFRADMTREQWAGGFAQAWWEASGAKFGQRELQNFEHALVYAHENIYGHLPCHLALLHVPDVYSGVLPVCFGIWQASGDRDSQLRMLVHADDPAAMEPPVVEEARTPALGTGLRCIYYQRERHGPGVLASLNYAWRSEEYDTDVRVFTAAADLGRLQGALGDIEALTQVITMIPRAQ